MLLGSLEGDRNLAAPCWGPIRFGLYLPPPLDETKPALANSPSLIVSTGGKLTKITTEPRI